MFYTPAGKIRQLFSVEKFNLWQRGTSAAIFLSLRDSQSATEAANRATHDLIESLRCKKLSTEKFSKLKVQMMATSNVMRMRLKEILFCIALFLNALFSSHAANYEPSTIVPPQPLREFRGVWIATVANTDWPSKRGLSTAEQKTELISILERAAQLKLNAVIFQVRPACDALYASQIEPWSEYLTGTMGKAPDPYYDPLAFAIEEAHKRGLELHAWFNPYRARHFMNNSPVAPNHISKTHPELVRSYGKFLWLDPGEHGVQDYSLSVVMDVVKRYDVDGVHFDDYFYPYPEKNAASRDLDFPDDASWKKFGERSGLSRNEWRRENVNAFIERVYQSIKATKPWVKFGISPFGIWRTQNPPQIKGFDAYAKLYADSRKWLANGWLDYFAPQLYWQIEQPKEPSFSTLLNWWTEQNPKGRNLWPGLALYKAGPWKPDEIPNQIQFVRKRSGATGYIFYNASSLMHNTALAQVLEREINAQPALIPASPWLGSASPARPKVFTSGATNELKLSWAAAGTNSVRWWVVQTKISSDWKTEILPASVSSKTLSSAPEILAVTAVDRNGNAGIPCVLQIKKYLTPATKRVLDK